MTGAEDYRQYSAPFAVLWEAEKVRLEEGLNRPTTPEKLLPQFTAAIQFRLDEFARTRGYDNILSAASYAASTNPQFRTEGEYAVAARDAA